MGVGGNGGGGGTFPLFPEPRFFFFFFQVFFFPPPSPTHTFYSAVPFVFMEIWELGLLFSFILNRSRGAGSQPTMKTGPERF